MICITEIKVINCQYDHMNFAHLPWRDFAQVVDSEPPEYVEVTKELVTGKQFINANGDKVCIGMTKQVQDYIGLPFEAFENMRAEIENNKEEIRYLELGKAEYHSRLAKYNNGGFFYRLRCLFAGRI